MQIDTVGPFDLFDQLPCPSLVTNMAGQILICNAELLEMLGSTQDALNKTEMAGLFAPVDQQMLRTSIWPALMRQEPVCEKYMQLQVPQHDPVPVLVNAKRCKFEGVPCYQWVLFVARERSRFEAELVTANEDARRIAAELADQIELLQVTMTSIGDAVVTTDADSLVTWLNPVAERLTGWPMADAMGQPISEVFTIVDAVTRIPTASPTLSSIRQDRPVGLPKHTLLISRSGIESGVEDTAAPIRNAAGEILGAVLVFHDVTAQRQMSGEIAFRATHDSLTGLVNRGEFELRLQGILATAHLNPTEHALLYIDLDQFKLVNDACGHTVGDQLLQQVSELLGSVVRMHDTLARLCGDEFGLILENCNIDRAQRVGQQICELMDDFRFTHDGRRFRIGASIGLVPVDARWATAEVLLQAADASCCAAKDAGRNRVHTWFDTDQEMLNRRGEMQWTTRIEQALDDDSFVLYAQRIQAMHSDSHGAHAEVLLRMRAADGTMISPDAFMPAAERFNMATRIDRWVVSNTLRWMSELPDLDLVENLSINLSGQSIGDRAFQRWVLEALGNAGNSVCIRLTFEITETSAVTNLADASHFFEKVRALGSRIALDDFGAGASSFGYLKGIQVDSIKIDGQFIKNVDLDGLDAAAVRCFIDVAHVIGVKTVAEYVETESVLDHLREIGVDYAQGYLLHRPEPLANMVPTNSVAALEPN